MVTIQMRQALVHHRNTIFQKDSQRSDLLDPIKTKDSLILLLSDLCITKNHPFEFTAIKSDHHDDSDLGQHSHFNGYCADGWFLASSKAGDYLDAQDKRFLAALHDAGLDPNDNNIGLGGSAWTHADIVAAGVSRTFQDNGSDHVHLSAK